MVPGAETAARHPRAAGVRPVLLRGAPGRGACPARAGARPAVVLVIVGALSGLLITSLEQSRKLKVLTRGRMFDLLRRPGRGKVERIDESAAREVGLKARVRTLLLASIQKLGRGYVVEPRAIDPQRDHYLFTLREQATDHTAILPLIDRLWRRCRPGPRGWMTPSLHWIEPSPGSPRTEAGGPRRLPKHCPMGGRSRPSGGGNSGHAPYSGMGPLLQVVEQHDRPSNGGSLPSAIAKALHGGARHGRAP